MIRRVFFALLTLVSLNAGAQILTPVKWSFSYEPINNTDGYLVLSANIDKGWHMYSQYIGDEGPVPTSFRFTPSKEYELKGKVKEVSKAITQFDDAFGVELTYFEKKAVFKQQIKLKSILAFNVKGDLEFMVCDDKQCLPPETIEFAIDVKAKPIIESIEGSAVLKKDSIVKDTVLVQKEELKPAYNTIPEESDYSLWGIFIAGFLGGFLALLTPCVFPMIPLTVSFFTKHKGSKAHGIYQALLYGASIIVLYVALGMVVTLLFGADALNELASNAFFNLLFFVLLVVFGVSFLGAFEITLPSSWVNKMDSKSDKGGWIGIFFMAFTLALVSFSCTGPIIGTLLVQAAVGGEKIGPIIGMTGFSVALALPFTLFALFPSWMKSLPKSGGWLNSVKVVLGFLELALALKFLSNVDLAYHWGILDREVFLVLWIIIFSLLGLYLLGKLKFSHDSDLPYVSIPRLFLAIASLSFALYMVPGLWGAPLKAISAFSPPQATQDFDLSRNLSSHASPIELTPGKKYADILHCPHGLNCFFDFDEGMAYAKKVGKPVFIDFTGHSCVNCRKMEASVWSDPQVLKRLNEDYVLISLYVDDKTELPENEKYTSKFSGKKIKTLGNKWSDLEATNYGINSQPYYVLLDHEGNKLTAPQAFNLDINNYIRFLDEGKKAFTQKQNSSK